MLPAGVEVEAYATRMNVAKCIKEYTIAMSEEEVQIRVVLSTSRA